MNTLVTITPDVRRARRAFVLVGLVAPIVVAAVVLTLIIGWLPDLPDQVVTHWGSGGPDGYGSPAVYIWMQCVLGLVIPLLMTVPILLMMKQSWGITCRFLGATSLGSSALVAVVTAGSAWMQREPATAPFGIGTVVAIGFAAMVLFGVIGWLLQPNVTASPASEDQTASQIRLAPGEKAAWFGTAAMGRTGVITLLLAVLLLIGSTIWVLILGEATAVWITALATLLVIALIATTLVFRVRVNRAGLLVRSAAGWPRWNIPASEIADVQVVQINPMAEFGGWGLRVAVDGRAGVVLRTGEGLQVTRTSGKVFVVTIDDAATAAAVLTAALHGVDHADRGDNL